jgi:hypothetical protein
MQEIFENIKKSVINNDYKSFVLLCEQFDKSCENDKNFNPFLSIFCQVIQSDNTNYIDYLFQNQFRIFPTLIRSNLLNLETVEYLVENYFNFFIDEYISLFKNNIDSLFEQYYYQYEDDSKYHKIIKNFIKIFLAKLSVYFENIENIKKSRELYLTILKFYYRIKNNFIILNCDDDRDWKIVVKKVRGIMLMMFNDFFRKEGLVLKIIKEYPLDLLKLKDKFIIPGEIINDTEFLLLLNEKINIIKKKQIKYVIFV